MATETTEIETLANREYKWGFETSIEADSLPPGLNEDTIRFISAKKGEPEWMLEWRLKAYRHWLTMEEPHEWPHLKYPKIDYQASSYFSAPLRYRYDFISHRIFTPLDSICSSASAGASSTRSSMYEKPEQPPPFTPTRRRVLSSGSP